jgi:hypothetical protein
VQTTTLVAGLVPLLAAWAFVEIATVMDSRGGVDFDNVAVAAFACLPVLSSAYICHLIGSRICANVARKTELGVAS